MKKERGPLDSELNINLNYMEESKKIEFESYLESQGLDKETEEKIAKEKSEKLARIHEIKADPSMTANDKIQELLSIISAKVSRDHSSTKRVRRVRR